MPVEAAACFDSSPFARLQPPVLLAADRSNALPQLPLSSADDEESERRRLLRALQIFAALLNCI